VLPFWILYNNWSFLLVLLSSNISQPVSLYRYSVLVKIGSPVIILAASNCSLSNLHELETPLLSQTSPAYSNIGRMYNFSKCCLFNLYFNLRKTHMCLETLFIIFSTCLFHLPSSLNVIQFKPCLAPCEMFYSVLTKLIALWNALYSLNHT
jgi:hypothetical protein